MRRQSQNTASKKAASQDSEVNAAGATQILQAALKEDCSASELAGLAAADPGFALRVLKWVNSPAFSRARQVSDVRQACSRLGVRGLRNLALTIIVSDMTPTGEACKPLIANAIRRALAARQVALKVMPAEADSAFTAGLLLEAGLLLGTEDSLETVAGIARGPASARIVRERASGRPPHTVTGAELAAKYGLPDPIRDAIAHHHDATIPQAPLERLAWTAEVLSAVFEGGDPEECLKVAHACATEIGLKAEDLETILEELPESVVEAAKVFERDVEPQRTVNDILHNANRRLVEMNLQYEETLQALEALVDEQERLSKELKEANARLEDLAHTDVLTGLANKRALMKDLERELARAQREKTPLSLAILDVDDFKKLNDTRGHDAGDDVLRGLGAIISEQIRIHDIAARFGGEEFVVLMPATPISGAAIAAERIRAAIEKTPFKIANGALRITVSTGLAVSTNHGPLNSEALFKAADEALYAAKRQGKNCVVTADKAKRASSGDRTKRPTSAGNAARSASADKTAPAGAVRTARPASQTASQSGSSSRSETASQSGSSSASAAARRRADLRRRADPRR